MIAPMYSVEVREHIMIAHSLPGPVFGPAQNLHGATYVVDVAFLRSELTEDGIVVDIGRALETLRESLAPINYANLDTLPEFEGVKTTTEVLCRWVFDKMRGAIAEGRLGDGADGIEAIRVTLVESHVAKASFEGPVAG